MRTGKIENFFGPMAVIVPDDNETERIFFNRFVPVKVDCEIGQSVSFDTDSSGRAINVKLI